MTAKRRLLVSGWALCLAVTTAAAADAPLPDAPLPPGVKAVWDLGKAQRDTTPTRERVCLNGLWRWQPASEAVGAVPTDRWGFFKAPGFWPGASSYIQEDTQTLFAHPAWKGADVRGLRAAWYQREFTVPKDWTGRRISLSLEYVNSLAVVFVDGKKAGEVRFPAGAVDLSDVCKPGGKHVLSLHVTALPLKGVLLSYTDTNTAREVKGNVDRRGLCGDVFLTSEPANPRLSTITFDTSVRRGEVRFEAALADLAKDEPYALRFQIRAGDRTVHSFTSKTFTGADLDKGRFSGAEKWRPEKLWDIHTPGNQLEAQVTLVAKDKVLDALYPVRFGFREFWIDGKDFYLNGTRLYLSAVPLDSAQIGARTASYEGARETLKRLQSFGINFVYTHNYGCEPGSHVSFTEVLRAADDVGMLVALSQPHFSHYDWKARDADAINGYVRHAAFFVQAAQNHPAVVAYSMSHNATGYADDMNPDRIDGLKEPRDEPWSKNNAKLALRAEAIVKRLDPSRVVYHHSSGDLGSMHTCNFYVNFAPVQEMCDWFGHWATEGVKPVFLVEYGVPFSWDWTMYRGWYKGERSFGSAKVPWEFCLAEWNSQFVGDRAFRISPAEARNLRWEAGQFRKGALWHRWDYPHQVGSADFVEREEIFARYITDNWRAFRTWGVSATSPWEHHLFWKLKPGVAGGRRDFKVDWDALQKPGFSADYTERRNWQMITDFESSDWQPTAAAEALYRNNRPLLAYIAGPPGDFTSRGHTYLPGETVEKQLIIVNNSRETVACDCAWAWKLSKRGTKVSVPTGEQKRIPLRFELPATLAPGAYDLTATVRFGSGEKQEDTFTIHVLPRAATETPKARIALFDPKGETTKLLAGLKTPFDSVKADTDLSGYDLLIIGKGALTPTGPGPNVDRVRDGLKVVVFEQTADVLQDRFGFRVAEYGLREVFPRVSDHPLLAGLRAEHLRDWRGAATLLSPRLAYTLRPRHGPTVKWCGIDVPHVWRCGCRGNVASVLIERPARGDFLSIIDGGYSLQYSPLLEYREGKGMVLFCQLDVTGRTENDPAAHALIRNILTHASAWKPGAARELVYAGDPTGKRHLEACGFVPRDFASGKMTAGSLLVVGPGGSKALAGDGAAVAAALERGGRILALGLSGAETKGWAPFTMTTKNAEHIAAFFEPFSRTSPLAGVGPADVHNRNPRTLPLVAGGPDLVGDGVLARSKDGAVVFCQLVPWEFDPKKQMNLKRTFRRASCLVTRLTANLGAAAATPLLARVRAPVKGMEERWLDGFYLDMPEEWDDPYRFFRW
ncbi:MAG: hypothetical protein U0793_24245 [Gemmataceae bacterium]